jgi:hypothetical protein
MASGLLPMPTAGMEDPMAAPQDCHRDVPIECEHPGASVYADWRIDSAWAKGKR